MNPYVSSYVKNFQIWITNAAPITIQSNQILHTHTVLINLMESFQLNTPHQSSYANKRIPSYLVNKNGLWLGRQYERPAPHCLH